MEMQVTYGGGNTPSTVFYREANGYVWYVLENSVNYNCCPADQLIEGESVETISDIDMFTGEPAESDEHFQEELTDYLEG